MHGGGGPCSFVQCDTHRGLDVCFVFSLGSLRFTVVLLVVAARAVSSRRRESNDDDDFACGGVRRRGLLIRRNKVPVKHA